MNNEKIGPIEIIKGENQSRAPFSTSILITSQEQSTLIECCVYSNAYGKRTFNLIPVRLTSALFCLFS